MSLTKILLPIDINHDSTLLLKYACSIANDINARITCVYVMEDVSEPLNNFDKPQEKRRKAEIKLSEIVNEALQNENVSYDIIITKGKFSQRIINISNELNSSLIIMNYSNILPINKIVSKSGVPILLVSEKNPLLCRNILLPFNLEFPFHYKLQKALNLARVLNSSLNTLSFVANGYNSANPKKYKAALNTIEEFVEKENISCEIKFLSNENSINKIGEWLMVEL